MTSSALIKTHKVPANQCFAVLHLVVQDVIDGRKHHLSFRWTLMHEAEIHVREPFPKPEVMLAPLSHKTGNAWIRTLNLFADGLRPHSHRLWAQEACMFYNTNLRDIPLRIAVGPKLKCTPVSFVRSPLHRQPEKSRHVL